MESTTTDQQFRYCPEVQMATGRSAAKARTIVAAVVLAVMALLSGCGTPAPTEAASPAPTTAAAAATASSPAPAPASTPAAPPNVPVRQATPMPAAPKDPAPRSLTVEGTTINMGIVEVGVSPDGAMEIPEAFDQAGWYRHGPAPGAAAGAAVVAGHVDTTSDLAPLSQLNGLTAGTRVTIERDGAPALNYRVRSVELMAKDKFDGGSLFRRDGPHQLKIVTCGGRWLDDKQDYSDNVIVTAELE
ncbi:class F sortase [Pseudarthrobacter sp. R1]|uniref:class F sortase n=1 Tax=Pseudarthrobacter sp. R1 TaxID=2944934 RepID=UPI00210CBA15|nr:class F sortase [Pseudarthrobacter sp. R1]MCQ6270743.1 class F sortase [Pseudarthrobacter sp. R1]